MKCNYIIKLPNGGSISIPSKIGDTSEASMDSLEEALKA